MEMFQQVIFTKNGENLNFAQSYNYSKSRYLQSYNETKTIFIKF